MRYLTIITFFILFCMNLEASELKKQIVFIVNPISPTIKNKNIEKTIRKNLDLNQYCYKIVYTEHAGHATELAQKALESADIVAAIGGDGTVNEVGRALIDTHVALAIIPVGSGNGLARHLGIPTGLSNGIRALNYAHSTRIDTAKINDTVFLNVAGIGFDALIAKKFAHFGKRGLFSYGQVAIQEFQKYGPQNYLITIDGKPFVKQAFILSFANSSQYGNDFFICSEAKTDDGYLDLVIVKDIPLMAAPKLFMRFKQNTLDRSRYCETLKFKEITIQHPYMQAHVDGEPMVFHDSMHITVNPHSLKIMVPN